MLEWQNIDTVLLDLDGTLLDLHYDNYFWQVFVPIRYAQRHAISEQEALTELTRRYKAVEGTIHWYCVEYWSAELELDIPDLKAQLRHKIQVHPHVEDFLIALRRHSKRVLLVSNAHGLSIELKLGHTGLHRHFDHIVSSHRYAIPKENPVFWQKFVLDYNVNPHHSLFIDDSIAVLKSAREFGIRYIVAASRPDSQAPVKDTQDFPAIHSFAELLPIA